MILKRRARDRLFKDSMGVKLAIDLRPCQADISFFYSLSLCYERWIRTVSRRGFSDLPGLGRLSGKCLILAESALVLALVLLACSTDFRVSWSEFSLFLFLFNAERFSALDLSTNIRNRDQKVAKIEECGERLALGSIDDR